MADATPALTYAAAFAAYTALIMGGVAGVASVSGCGLASDLIDGGCASVVQDFAQIIVIGTIPHAPAEVNLLFGIIGLCCRFTLLAWLFEKSIWVALAAIFVGGVTALVAWLV